VCSGWRRQYGAGPHPCDATATSVSGWNSARAAPRHDWGRIAPTATLRQGPRDGPEQNSDQYRRPRLRHSGAILHRMAISPAVLEWTGASFEGRGSRKRRQISWFFARQTENWPASGIDYDPILMLDISGPIPRRGEADTERDRRQVPPRTRSKAMPSPGPWGSVPGRDAAQAGEAATACAPA